MLRNKRSFYEEVDEEGSWAISYGDLVTLLMSFFVIYFSTDFREKKETLLDASLVESMNELKHEQLVKERPDIAPYLENTQIKKMNEDNYLVFFKGVSFFDVGRTVLKPSAREAVKALAQKVLPYLSEFKLVVYAYTDDLPVRNGRRYKDNIELSALRSIAVLRELFANGVDKDRVEITGRGVLSPKALHFMEINPNDNNSIRSMQRTTAFVLKRTQGE